MINRRRLQYVLLMFLALVLVSGCTGNKAMQDKQQGIAFKAIYKSVFLDVKAVNENPMATEAEKKLAKEKLAALDEVYPLIVDFLTPIDPMNPSGPIVGYALSDAKIEALLKGIDKLTKLATKGGA